MRKKILAGNWKMNLNRTESVLLVKEILSRINHNIDVDIVLAPSFVNLYKVAKICMHHNNIFIASICAFSVATIAEPPTAEVAVAFVVVARV